MTARRLEPGPDHPITVAPTDDRVVVRFGETIVAETTGSLTLREAEYPPVQYVPLRDIDPTLLRESPTTTYCPYKGECHYYDLVVGDEVVADAVWTYRTPYDAVADIVDHAAFYPGKVDVAVAGGSD